MKKTTAFLLAACLGAPLLSHAIPQTASAAAAGGLSAWWVAEDYTNTNQGTAANWTDRVAGIQATADAGGKGVYPYLNSAGNGITFTRSGATRTDPGAFFNVTANPVAGQKDYTILVDFTPSAAGSTGSGHFWQDSGLVAAEQAGVTNDWGLGYNSDGHVVVGTNGMTVDSTGTVEVGTNAIAGMTVSGGVTGTWINGVLSRTGNGSSSPRNNTTMFIGKMGADGGWYAGDIGEIRIFNRALTAGEMEIYSNMMKNGAVGYIWASGTGNWTDSVWTTETGTTGALAANSHAFFRGGTLTMAASPVVKSLVVGSGTTSETAILNATADTQKGAQAIYVIPGGTLKTDSITTKVYYEAGTIDAPKLEVKSGGLFQLNKPFTVDASTSVNEIVVNGGTVQDDGKTSPNVQIGSTGTGKLILNSGTFKMNGIMAVGASAGGNGTVEINGGSLQTGPGIDIGATDAQGVLTLNNGTVKANNFNAGHRGTGTINLKNGFLTANSYFSIADQPTATGFVNVSGGSHTSQWLSIGNRGTGTYTQTGGFHTADHMYVSHSNDAAVGRLNLSNGVLKVKQDSTIQVRGDGKMTLSGDAVFNTKSLANAQYLTFEGGTLMTNSITGDLNQTGGKLVVGGNVSNGLKWTRQKWTNVTDAFPGYTTQSGGHYVPTYEQIDAFWEKAMNAEPVASGVGAVGSGIVNEDYFSILYNGWIYIDKDDSYKFTFNGDDGCFIYVDGKKVSEISTVQTNAPWGKDSVGDAVQLSQGWHHFDLRYYDGWGGQGVNKATMTDSSGKVTDLKSLANENFAMMNYEKELTELRIDGSYTQSKGGALFMELDLTSGEHDRLLTVEDLHLEGDLFISVTGEIAETYEFELFGTENGEMDFSFANISFDGVLADAISWDLSGLRAGGDGILRISTGGDSSVPEPSACVLLLLGAFGIGFLRKTRKAAVTP